MNSNNVKFVDGYQGTIISTLCLERQKGWIMGMDLDELARESVCMNRAIARCLHHLAATLPGEKTGGLHVAAE